MTVRHRNRRAAVAVRSSVAALVLFAGISGCIMLPPPSTEELKDEELAHSPPPAEWTAEGAVAGTVQDDWLDTFSDARLEELVAEAIQYNGDLRAAAARAEQAAAYVRAAGGQLWPAVTALGRGGGEMSGDDSGLEGWLVSASWELDLWGRVRYSKRSAEEQYASTEADFRFARQSLAALVAKSWFLATEARLQEQFLTSAVDAAAKLLELAEQRLRVGIGNELDVASARVTLQTYRDSLRQVQLAKEQSLRALELLIGRYPAAEIVVPTVFADLASEVPAGLPSELLERRPDIIAAEKRVAAAFSRVKEAQAARLPSISITGGVSDITSELFVLAGPREPGLERGWADPGAAVQGRSTQGAGRDPDGRAEAGGCAIRADRAEGVQRRGKRPVEPARPASARGDPDRRRGGLRARACARPDPLPRRSGRPALGAAAAGGLSEFQDESVAGAERAARTTREPAPCARR